MTPSPIVAKILRSESDLQGPVGDRNVSRAAAAAAVCCAAAFSKWRSLPSVSSMRMETVAATTSALGLQLLVISSEEEIDTALPLLCCSGNRGLCRSLLSDTVRKSLPLPNFSFPDEVRLRCRLRSAGSVAAMTMQQCSDHRRVAAGVPTGSARVCRFSNLGRPHAGCMVFRPASSRSRLLGVESPLVALTRMSPVFLPDPGESLLRLMRSSNLVTECESESEDPEHSRVNLLYSAETPLLQKKGEAYISTCEGSCLNLRSPRGLRNGLFKSKCLWLGHSRQWRHEASQTDPDGGVSNASLTVARAAATVVAAARMARQKSAEPLVLLTRRWILNRCRQLWQRKHSCA